VTRPPADFAPGLEGAFELPQEGAGAVRIAAGAVPAGLRGTCYWNGPARFARGELRYRHWLDGDGMIAALAFGGAGGVGEAGGAAASHAHGDAGSDVHFANRFVRSAKWMAEEQAGRALFRAFGTRFAGDRLERGIALASPVNVSVIPFAGTLLACGEQGLPCEIDPATLATRGPFTFGGGLNPVSPFAAHAKIDPATGDLYNFGLSYSRQSPCLHLYRFAAGGTLIARHRVGLALPVSIHDFLLAPHHVVFHVSPFCLDLEAVTAAGACLHEALSWQPHRAASELLIVPRSHLEPAGPAPSTGEAAVLHLPLPGGYCLHGIAAGEDAAGRLVIDFLELDRPVYDQYQEVPHLLADVGAGRPVRLVVDLAHGRVVERQALSYELAPDFPVTLPQPDGRAPDDFWTLGIAAAGRPGRKFYDQLVHGSWRPGAPPPAVWQAPPGRYLTGEPAVAPAPPGQTGGTLICPLFAADRGESGYLLFDALDITAGPRAELLLGRTVPPAFHAAFVPAPDAANR
jgi:all-trans-8'-apo-beta-carotenal 15,15'-oxygenase